jgi:hypothetical protein
MEELEEDVANMRTTLAVLLDRLERRFGPEVDQLKQV